MFVVDRSFEQRVEEELAKMDPASLGADKRKTPYCKRHGSTDVLWHERGNTNITDDSCELRGYCYPCIRARVYTQAYYPGTVPPRAHKIKCTDAFHDYLYWVDLSDVDFLKHRKPAQITEKEANFLRKQVPEYEKKGEALYLFP